MKSAAKGTNLARRYLLFFVGLGLSSLGGALSQRSCLGVSPLSSIANCISIAIPSISFGTWLFFWNCLLIVLQICILRREFEVYQLLQLPMSVIFGFMIDASVFLVSFLPNSNYFYQFVLLILGIVTTAVGVCMAVIADVLMNSGEALVAAVAKKCPLKFGTIKIYLDILYTVLAVLLSLVLFDKKLVGVREGTVIVAVFTGMVVNVLMQFYSKHLERSSGFTAT